MARNKVYIRNKIKDEERRKALEEEARKNLLWGVQKDRSKAETEKAEKQKDSQE